MDYHGLSFSGETSSGSTDSGSYMIIAGYVALSLSGATPITLTTTLTHIHLGDEKIATFQSQTDDTPKTPDDDKLIYHISDHLNSSSLDLSSTGILMQAVDYLPFGKKNVYEVSNTRIKGKKGGYKNKYLFANKQQDDETDLQYFEKRYYDNRIGRFTTEDPVFWEVGLTKRPNQYFTDPQQWNTYSYVRNNPINLVDPTGEIIDYSKTYTDSKTGYSYYQATNLTLQDVDNHYLSNNGTAIQVSFSEIDTSFITPTSFNAISAKINFGVPGEYVFKGKDAEQSLVTTLGKDYNIFGNLTFVTEGKLTINDDGAWNYNGTLKTKDDIYDFNVDKKDWGYLTRFPRNVATYLRSNFVLGKGTAFDIQIRGEKQLQGMQLSNRPTTGQGGLSTNGVTNSANTSKSKTQGRANLSNGPLLK